MRKLQVFLTCIAVLAGTSALAQMKPCDELRSEIDAKLKEKGVKNYTLEIVANDEVKDQKVVGSCDGGTKKITYSRK